MSQEAAGDGRALRTREAHAIAGCGGAAWQSGRHQGTGQAPQLSRDSQYWPELVPAGYEEGNTEGAALQRGAPSLPQSQGRGGKSATDLWGPQRSAPTHPCRPRPRPWQQPATGCPCMQIRSKHASALTIPPPSSVSSPKRSARSHRLCVVDSTGMGSL